jgi:hypothetical protein
MEVLDAREVILQAKIDVLREATRETCRYCRSGMEAIKYVGGKVWYHRGGHSCGAYPLHNMLMQLAVPTVRREGKA